MYQWLYTIHIHLLHFVDTVGDFDVSGDNGDGGDGDDKKMVGLYAGDGGVGVDDRTPEGFTIHLSLSLSLS